MINKKASSILMMVFELVIVVTVIGLALSYSSRLSESSSVNAVNLANDIKLMIDTSLSVPGDYITQYPRNISSYEILLSSDEVIVNREGRSSLNEISRRVYLPDGYTASGLVRNTDYLCFRKQGRLLEVINCAAEEIVK